MLRAWKMLAHICFLYRFIYFFLFFCFSLLTPAEASYLPLLITLAVMLISHKNDMIKPEFILFASKRDYYHVFDWMKHHESHISHYDFKP